MMGRDGIMADKITPAFGDNKLQIRNSTVDFLVVTKDAHEEGKYVFLVRLGASQ